MLWQNIERIWTQSFFLQSPLAPAFVIHWPVHVPFVLAWMFNPSLTLQFSEYSPALPFFFFFKVRQSHRSPLLTTNNSNSYWDQILFNFDAYHSVQHMGSSGDNNFTCLLSEYNSHLCRYPLYGLPEWWPSLCFPSDHGQWRQTQSLTRRLRRLFGKCSQLNAIIHPKLLESSSQMTYYSHCPPPAFPYSLLGPWEFFHQIISKSGRTTSTGLQGLLKGL